jgi:hypothetical protein
VTFDPTAPSTPTPGTVDSPDNILIGVACPSAIQCTAVDRVGNEVTFNPTALLPVLPFTIDAGGILNAVACPSVSQCTAVGHSGIEVTFNPTAPDSPSPATVEANLTELLAVACPSVSQCTAVDRSGDEVTFNPTAPGGSTPIAIDAGKTMYGVACPSVSQCTAVGSSGYPGLGDEVTFNPTAPGTPSPNLIDSTNSGVLLGVTCPSTAECIISGTAHVWQGNPARPDTFASVPLPGANGLGTIACTSLAQCVTVDFVGHAFVGTESTSASVSCAPGAVVLGSATTCTATVNDAGSAPLSAPSGNLSFTSDGAGSFGGGRSCTLAATATAGQASCAVSYTPSAVGSGSHAITASYPGDGSHPPGGAKTTVTVSPPSASTSKPDAITRAASQIAQHSVNLNGAVNPEGTSTSSWFQYGTGTGYGKQTSTTAAGAGTGSVPASAALSNLTAGTRYHYRIVASSAAGTTYGGDATFITRPLPAPRGLSVKATPSHASVAPYRFRFAGRMLLPLGIGARQGCVGVIVVQIRHGAKTVATLRVGLSRTCRYSTPVSFSTGRLPGHGRLKVTVRFLGNGSVAARTGKPIYVRHG